MQDFRKLEVWQVAHQLTLRVYEATKAFPREEIYGLASQIRRPSSSIPSNIAEGCGRQSDSDFKRFLHMAMGSACEVEYQIQLASDLRYLDAGMRDELDTLVIRTKQKLASLIRRLIADSRV